MRVERTREESGAVDIEVYVVSKTCICVVLILMTQRMP